MSSEYQKPGRNIDILLVTVTSVEAEAVLRVFMKETGQPFQRHFIGDKTYFDLGVLGGASITMVQSEMGAGGSGGSLLVVDEGIRMLSPSAVIMVGIAFGVDEAKQSRGNILVSQQLLAYELQKIAPDDTNEMKIIPRGDRAHASTRLLDRFRSGSLDWHDAKVEFGVILSGDKLIDHQRFRDQLRKLAPEAIGGEMEGTGLYSAAQRRKVDWIVVKAICDWADGNKKLNKDRYQLQAAENATKFIAHVFKQGGFANHLPESKHRDQDELERHIQELKNRLSQIKRARSDDQQGYDFGKFPLSELRRRTMKHDRDIQETESKLREAETSLQLQKLQLAASSRAITLTSFSEGKPASFFHFETDEIFIGKSVTTATPLAIGHKKGGASPSARIYQRGDGWWIEKVPGEESITVDNVPLTRAMPLTVGTICKIGDALLTINYGDALETSNELHGSITTEFEIHETVLPASVTEQDRLVLRSQISPLLQHYQGQELLDMLVKALLTFYPEYEEKRASIALYRNGALIFPAYSSPDRSYASTTLTYYTINSRKAFIWDEHLGLDRPASAMDMASAMYVPILSHYRVYGAIHLDTTSLAKAFSRQDLETLTELARLIAPKVIAISTNTLTPLPSVFLSSAQEDIDFMRSKLVPDLRRRRVDVWWNDSLQMGEERQKQINDAIRGTDVFCLLLSQPAIDSAQIQWELDKAKFYKKPIIPLFQSDATFPKKYHFLSKLQCCFIHQQYDVAIDQLVNRLYVLKSQMNQDASHDA